MLRSVDIAGTSTCVSEALCYSRWSCQNYQHDRRNPDCHDTNASVVKCMYRSVQVGLTFSSEFSGVPGRRPNLYLLSGLECPCTTSSLGRAGR